MIKIPEQYNQRTAKTIANDLLEFIVDRTKQGKGKDGKDFPDYSKTYKESVDYRIAGKDGTVDLTLSGEMLDSLTVLSAGRGQIVLGYPEGDPNNGKAEGNILGSYGGQPNKKRARNFLDLSEKEIASILKDYPLDAMRERLDNVSAAELARLLADEIASNVEFDDG